MPTEAGDAPSDHEHELARLRREAMVARDALIGATAEQAVLAARVVTLEHEVANLEATVERFEALAGTGSAGGSGLRQRLRSVRR